MTKTRRPVSELPADPAHLRLSYSHDHPAEPYDFEDTLEAWHVSIRTYHFEEEECEGGCTAECQELIDSGREVGYVRLWRVRDYTGDNRWEAADAESGDLEAIAATVFDVRTDEYSQAFEEFIECPVGDLLILDRVFLSKEWRGFGLGPVFAAEAIRRLAGGCCAVAAQPGLGEWPEGVTEVPRAYREEATKKIAALWRSIGFRDFAGGVQLFDPALRELSELLGKARRHLPALSSAYSGRPAGPSTEPHA
ncbi:hypothetical protein ABGT92_07745 [Streptomyces cinereoruber]|uniref:hypothetical protein n=1 Tax=Streptomyces cinereoruber TaxID=67260 RepID=UPI00345DEA97